VNAQGSGDMYPKGGTMLHTIRQLVNDDEKWREILRGLNREFRHQTVMGRQVEEYISRESGMDLAKVFDQYLRDVRIPELEYRRNGDQLSYRWVNVVEGFNMPVEIKAGEGPKIRIEPTLQWQSTSVPAGAGPVEVDPDYYVTAKEVVN
jgi:aminopeptidase N